MGWREPATTVLKKKFDSSTANQRITFHFCQIETTSLDLLDDCVSPTLSPVRILQNRLQQKKLSWSIASQLNAGWNFSN